MNQGRQVVATGNTSRLVLAAACVFVTAIEASPPAASDAESADRAALAAEVARRNDELRHAWELKDARLVFKEGMELPAIRRPDGTLISRAELIADLQRRMNMVRSIDRMSEEVTRIDLDGDLAVVVSRQHFKRLLVLPGGAERRRISQVTHRQRYRRIDGVWRAEGPTEESEPIARWEDEPEG